MYFNIGIVIALIYMVLVIALIIISFQNDIQTIFNANNCMDCHNANRNPDLRDGNAYNSLVPTYVVADNADGSSLYTFLESGHRDIADEQLELIKAWINQGAANN